MHRLLRYEFLKLQSFFDIYCEYRNETCPNARLQFNRRFLVRGCQQHCVLCEECVASVLGVYPIFFGEEKGGQDSAAPAYVKEAMTFWQSLMAAGILFHS